MLYGIIQQRFYSLIYSIEIILHKRIGVPSILENSFYSVYTGYSYYKKIRVPSIYWIIRMFPSILYREIQIIPIPIYIRDSVFHIYRVLEFPLYWRIRVMLLMFSFDAYVHIVDADSLVCFSYKRFQENID